MSKGRGHRSYPNTADPTRAKGYDALIAAETLGESFTPNRAQRRDYVRVNQPRHGRKYLVGFGRWRRHHDRADYPITPDPASTGKSLRRERRDEMIREAKLDRLIKRLQGE